MKQNAVIYFVELVRLHYFSIKLMTISNNDICPVSLPTFVQFKQGDTMFRTTAEAAISDKINLTYLMKTQLKLNSLAPFQDKYK